MQLRSPQPFTQTGARWALSTWAFSYPELSGRILIPLCPHRCFAHDNLRPPKLSPRGTQKCRPWRQTTKSPKLCCLLSTLCKNLYFFLGCSILNDVYGPQMNNSVALPCDCMQNSLKCEPEVGRTDSVRALGILPSKEKEGSTWLNSKEKGVRTTRRHSG